MAAQFKVDTRELVNALTSLAKLVDNDKQGIIHIQAKKSKDESKPSYVKLSAKGELRFASIQFPAEVISSGGFAANREVLQGLFKKRADVTVTDKGGSMSFTSQSGYSGKNIPLLPEPDEVEITKSETIVIPNDVKANLLIALNACSLVSQFETEAMPLYIRASNHEMIILAADSLHMAIVRCALSEKHYEAMKHISYPLPTSYTAIISKFTADNLRLSYTESTLEVRNDSVYIQLPSLQLTKGKYEDFYALTEELNQPDLELSVDTKEIDNLLSNLVSVKDPGVGILLVYGDKSLTLTYKSNNGRISDTIPSAMRITGKHAKATIDIDNLRDIIAKINGVCNLRFYKQFNIVEFSKKLTEKMMVRYMLAELTETK